MFERLLAKIGFGWVGLDEHRWFTERETPYGSIQRWQEKEMNRYTGKVRWRNLTLTRWREPRSGV